MMEQRCLLDCIGAEIELTLVNGRKLSGELVNIDPLTKTLFLYSFSVGTLLGMTCAELLTRKP